MSSLRVVDWTCQLRLANLALESLAGNDHYRNALLLWTGISVEKICLLAFPCWNEGVMGGTIIIYIHFIFIPPS